MGTTGQILSGAASVGGLLADVLDIGGQARRDRQADQQNRLNEQAAATNYKWGEMSADNAFKRQMEMYERSHKDNSPLAKRKQLEEAGLSTALMYGAPQSVGGAGQISGAPQGATGGANSGYASDEIARTGMGLQMAKLGAEVQLLTAQAEKAEAEADKTAGIDTKEKEIQIESITQDIQNKKVQRTGMILQNTFDEIRNEISSETKEIQIEKLTSEADLAGAQWYKIQEEIGLLETQGKISSETAESKIKEINLQVKKLAVEVTGAYLQNEMTKAGIELSRTQAETLMEGVLIQKTGNRLRLEELKLDLEKLELESIFKRGQLEGNMYRTVIDGLSRIAGSFAIAGRR